MTPKLTPESPAAEGPPRTEFEQRLTGYIRAKVDQLLQVIGTLPLRPEELDDETLISLDPIGILAESFTQVLEHLHEMHDELNLAHDESRAILDSVGAAILVLDGNFSLCSCNAYALDSFALPATVKDGTTRLDAAVLLPADLLARLKQASEPFELTEFLLRNKAYHLSVMPVMGSNQVPRLFVLMFHDVTEQRHTEKVLLEAQNRLSTILNSMIAGVLLIDPRTHRIVEANQVAVRMIGERRDKIIGMESHRYFCSYNAGRQPTRELKQVLEASEGLLLSVYGDEIPVLRTATLLEIDDRSFILESFIDIGKRKQVEEDLRLSEQRYRALYASMNEGLIVGELICNAQGQAIDFRVLDGNAAAGLLLECPPDQLVGERGSALYWQQDIPYLDLMAAVVRDGEAREYEIRYAQRELHVSLSRPQAGRFAALLSDVTDMKKAQREIERLAYFDDLTSLPNRSLIRDRLDHAIAQAQRQRNLVAVLMVDIDQFKKINDSLGNVSGDQLLIRVAERLQERLRSGDSIGRMGGDEFVVVSTCRSQQDIVTMAGKILDLMAEPFWVDGHEIPGTASLGIAVYPMDGDGSESLLKNADTAMYQAKENGRNTYQFYTPEMNRRAFERLFLSTDLHRALERNEFELYYQPQIRLSDQQVVGVEALLRWNHSSRGQISPVLFIPLAEESDLILSIGQWVLQQACCQARQWHDAGYRQLRVAVNVSARQFTNSLPLVVEEALKTAQLSPQLLELELTESLLMDKPHQVRSILERLQKLGTTTAIDDFGTGYSSLSYLKHFPINRLKIDRSFVKDLSQDSDDAILVNAIVALAHSLKLEVVAEGVETDEHIAFLRRNHCDLIQGYYVARPMSAAQLMSFLREGTLQ
ncbi:MAG: EAL domain-containing protein [Desulfuromonadaceae bacterium]|nr:EAL domain-containing protein [Desulfuromonadaceae bacterium]